MKNPLKSLLILCFSIVLLSGFVSAAVYTKNSFPTSSGNVVSCDGADRRLSCHDTGSGKNHNCVPVALNSCQAFEGRNNFGGPGCLIICEKEDRCTDGTLQGFCSQNVPLFCDNGNLIRRATVCGCPGNLVKSGEDCVQPQAQPPQNQQTCNDNTPFGQCSQTRPLFCNNGNLVNRAGSCGCPGGQVASGDNCVPQQGGQTCNDNTQLGQCSQTRPLFCDNGNLVNRAGSCGCPGGQVASGNNCVPGNQVTSAAGDKLVITDIDAEIDGRSSSNLDDNDKIGREAKPESDVELRITVKNEFTSSENLDIEDVTITATIEGVGGADIEEESNSFDLRPQSDKTATLRFKLPLSIDEGDYNIAIEATGEDENGDEHSDEADIGLEVQKERHDLRFLSFDLSPKTLECSKDISINSRIINIGSEDEPSASVRIDADGISVAEDTFQLMSDGPVSKQIRASTGNKLEPKEYTVTAGIYSSDGILKDTRASSLTVLNCTASGLFPMQNIIVTSYDSLDSGILSGLFSNVDWRGLIFFLAVIIIVLLVIVVIVSIASGIERQDI